MAVSVPIKFLGDFKEALDGVRDFSEKSSSSLSGIERTLTTVKYAAGALAGAFAFGKIISEFKGLIDEANEADKSLNKLRNAMRTAGDYSEKNIAVFEELSKAISQTSKFSREDAIQAYALAKSFNTTNEEAEKLVDTAVKLAKNTGRDLTESVMLLGRTLDGTPGKITEVVGAVRSLTQSQLVAGGAIDLVAERFGKASQDEFPTFAQVLDQVNKRSKEFREELGNSVVQNKVVIKAIQEISNAYFDLKESFSGDPSERRNFISESVIVAIKAIGFLVAALKTLQEPFEILKRDIADLFRTIASIPQAIMNGVSGRFDVVKNLQKSLEAAYKKDDEAGARRLQAYDDFGARILGIAESLDKVNEQQKKITKEAGETASEFDKQVPKVQRLAAEVEEAFKRISLESENFGKNEIQLIDAKYKKEIDLLMDYGNARPREFAKAEKLVFEVQKEWTKKRTELERKEYLEELAAQEEYFKKHQEKLKNLVQNPFAGVIEAAFGDRTNLIGLTTAVQQSVARGLGAVGQLLQGKSGAKKAFAGIGESLGQAFLGVPGFGQLVEGLLQGPETVKMMAKEFIRALPELVQALIEAVPALIEAIIDELPDLIAAIIDRLPQIVEKLVVALYYRLPRAVVQAVLDGVNKFINGFLNGVGKFLDKLLEGADKFIKRLIDGIGEGIKKIFEGIGKVGGGLFEGPGGGFGIGIGGGNSRIAIGTGGIQAGPIQISRPKLPWEKAGAGESSGGNIIVQVMLDRRQLADAIVDLNRYGYRLEPA